MNWYRGVTNIPEDNMEDSFILVGESLFNAYRNAIDIMSKNKNGRRLIKVIPAPHLDKYWKEKQMKEG